MNTREIIEDIQQAMERAKQLSNSTDNQYRKAFYSATSVPTRITGGMGTAELSDKISHLIFDTYRSGFTKYSVTVSVQDINVKNGVGLWYFHTKYSYRDGYYLFPLFNYKCEYLSKKPERFSIAFRKYLELLQATILTNLSSEKWLSTEESVYTRISAVLNNESSFNKVAKEFKTSLANIDSPRYIYYTDNNYTLHYEALYDNYNVSSCMADSPETFGNLYNKDFVSPLSGYDYAPDFRLGLVTTLSPEELYALTDSSPYPFTGRVVVSAETSSAKIYSYPQLDSPRGLAFGKVYGLESACAAVRRGLAQRDSPAGAQFYAIFCNDRYRWDTTTDSYYVKLLCNLEDNDIYQGHFVAPYIDTWNNVFRAEIPLTVKELPNGYRGLLVSAVRPYDGEDRSEDEFYDPEDDENAHLAWGIHHDSGIVGGVLNGETTKTVIALIDGNIVEYTKHYACSPRMSLIGPFLNKPSTTPQEPTANTG